jgi:hypothetical protein
MNWQVIYVQVVVTLLFLLVIMILFQVYNLSNPGLNWIAFLRLQEQRAARALQESDLWTRYELFQQIVTETESAQLWCPDSQSHLHFNLPEFLRQMQHQRQLAYDSWSGRSDSMSTAAR